MRLPYVNPVISQRLSLILLVAANLLPVAGVLFLDWSVFEILLLFWAENLIIGLYNVARMVTVWVHTGRRSIGGLIPFFFVHYGIFTVAHVMILLDLFGPDEVDVVPLLRDFMLPLLALIVSHGVSFLVNFIGQREYEGMSDNALMMAPYRRVIVMHLTILLGGFVVTALGEPLYALLLLVVLKLVIDLASHQRSHRKTGTVPDV